MAFICQIVRGGGAKCTSLAAFKLQNSIHFNSSSTLDAINSQNSTSFLLDGYIPGDRKKTS